MSRNVVIVAGEASADLHGANLVQAMLEADPRLRFRGIGGERMRKAGVDLLFTSSEMAVVGLTEVLGKLGTVARAAARLKALLKQRSPDLLILIDYPGFNLHIARAAKRFKVPVLYYVGPQVWAWRRGRVKKICRRVDRMAVILPFEKPFYAGRGMDVTFVGHPLLDYLPTGPDPSRTREDLGLEPRRPVVGLLPGSRREEVRQLLPAMLGAAGTLHGQQSGIQYLLPVAPTLDAGWLEGFMDPALSVKMVPGGERIYEILSACDVAMVASGTATLEVGLMGVPMVIAYKVSPVTYWLARRVVRVPHIGLVNLVAGEEVAPELIQEEVTAERLAHETLRLLRDPEARESMKEKLKRVRETLGRPGASERTAKIALQMMERAPGD
jgi:lipid-A-disaccharide synthase